MGSDYVLVLLATTGAAIAQPFLLNAWTTVSSQWFPRSQRATAVSLITLANLVGAGIGMALTPTLVRSMSISTVQLVYGGCALVAGVVFVAVARDRPPSPADLDGGTTETATMVGVRQALRVRPFVIFLAVVFVAMGVFNGLSTWVEEIVRPRGFSSVDAGNLGALLLLGGVTGAVVMSALSDRSGRRVPFMALALVVAAPALLWLTFADSLLGLNVAAFLVGFFMTSALPVGLQYAAEITAPLPEGTSNGLIQLFGQASVVVVFLMALTRTPDGSFVPALCTLSGLLLIGGVVVSRLPEPGRTSRGWLSRHRPRTSSSAQDRSIGATSRLPTCPASVASTRSPVAPDLHVSGLRRGRGRRAHSAASGVSGGVLDRAAGARPPGSASAFAAAASLRSVTCGSAADWVS